MFNAILTYELTYFINLSHCQMDLQELQIDF